MMRKAALEPVDYFAKDILQMELDLWQKEVTEAVADVVRIRAGKPTKLNHQGKNRFTIRSGHGTGKTFIAGFLMHWFSFCFQTRSPVLAPKLDQVKGRIFGSFADILSKAPEWYQNRVDQQATHIYFNSNKQWYYEAVAAAKPENAQGYHDNFMLVVIEEASGVKEELFPVIDGMLSTGLIVIEVMISNPTRTMGTFYDSHKKTGVREYYWQYHVSPDKVERPGFDTWLEQLIAKYGAESQVVKVRGLGEFADLTENQLMALEWIHNAQNLTLGDKYDGSLAKMRISVDCADGGDDRTVITVCKHYATFIHGIKQYRKDFPMYKAPADTANLIKELWDEFNCDSSRGDDVVVDYIGPGTGVVSLLSESRKDIPVIAYKGGSGSDDSQLWENRRTQSYIVARDFFRDGMVVFEDGFTDDWPNFEAQMTSIKTRPGAEAREALMTKTEMKSKGIKSPDEADSWAMQHATQMPLGMSEADLFELVPSGISGPVGYDGSLTT